MVIILQGSGGKTPDKSTTPNNEIIDEVSEASSALSSQEVKKDLMKGVEEEAKPKPILLINPDANNEVKSKTATFSPSRYCAIASLDEAAYDEDERWNDRTDIITKFDHEIFTNYARGFVQEIADQVVTDKVDIDIVG